jgi:ABC-type phosphate transport system substrate-binding protein
MQQILFIAGLAFIIFGIYSFIRLKKSAGIIGIISGVLLIAAAYLVVYLNNDEKDLIKTEISIRLNGSKTIGQYLMPELAKSYLDNNGFKIIAQEENAEIFRISGSKIIDKTNQIINFEIISKGSLNGFEALKNKEADIAMASTQMTSETASSLSTEFEKAPNKHIIGYDALRLIGHPSVKDKLRTINYKDFERIMSGEINDWNKVLKNKKGTINICLRDNNSGSFKFIEDKFLSHNIPDSSHKSAKFEQFDYFEKIAKKVSDDSLSLGLIDYGIDSVSLGNVFTIGFIINDKETFFPDADNISSFKYPLSRPLILYSIGDLSKNPMLESFIAFCQTEKAKEIVKKKGFVPIVK